MPDLHSDLYLFGADNGFVLAGGATGQHAGAWKDSQGCVHLFGKIRLPVASDAMKGLKPFLSLPDGWHPADQPGQPEQDAAVVLIAGQGVGGGGLTAEHVYVQGAANAADADGIGVWYWGDSEAQHELELTLNGLSYVCA